MRTIVVACLTGIVLSRAATAAAAPNAAASQAAEELFKEARQLAAEGRGEEARVKFLAAYSVAPTLHSLWNLAVSEHSTGHYVDALSHLRLVVADPEVTPRTKTSAEALIVEDYAKTGHVRVTGAAGGAVLVDGAQAIAYAPPTALLDVSPGRHTIEAHSASGIARMDVEATAGSVTDASFAQPVASPPPPPAAMLASSPPAADVERAPSHTAQFVTAGVLGGVAVASVVVGIVLRVNASSDHNHAETLVAGLPSNGCVGSTSSACLEANDALRREASEKDASTGLFIAAGALAAGAVASWFLLSPHAPQSATAWLAPELSPTSAGLTLHGRF